MEKNEFKKLVYDRGFNYQTLSLALNLSKTSADFSHYNTGKVKPDIRRIFQIANVLKVDYHVLLEMFYGDEIEQNTQIISKSLDEKEE